MSNFGETGISGCGKSSNVKAMKYYENPLPNVLYEHSIIKKVPYSSLTQRRSCLMILPTKDLKMGFMSSVCSWKGHDGIEKGSIIFIFVVENLA